MPTIFNKLMSGEIPCHKLHENDRFFSFLDVRPIAPGHALVIPKKEVDYIFDLEDELLREILLFARPVARAIKSAVPCKKIGIMVAGLEVPHAHVHLVPINGVNELSFANARPADQKELAELAALIRSRL